MFAHGDDLDSGMTTVNRKKWCAELAKFRSLHRVATGPISVNYPLDTFILMSLSRSFAVTGVRPFASSLN